MADELQIWALDSAGEVTLVEPTNRTHTENLLEDALVDNPDMLMPDLELVGRQTPTAGGYLDLLGVDAEGRLVVFELKRGTLTRDAVTQVIDYCSSLESMGDSELALHIADRSGNWGIDRIEDLEEWYDQRFRKPLDSLRPIRMALVGLGVDENATRMVNYLRDQGVSIALMTFYGYQHDGQTLLARHMERRVARDIDVQPPPPSLTFEERMEALRQHALNLGIESLWQEARTALSPPTEHYQAPTTRYRGVTFYHVPIHMEELVSAASAHGSHSVRLDPSGKIRVTFFPVAIELCYDEFVEEQKSIPFHSEPPPNAPPTDRAPEQLYCLLDADEWAEHKDALVGLVKAVDAAWIERLNSAC